MSIAIVSDSTCDLPVQVAEQYKIHIVPNILVMDGKNLEDGIDISRNQFYDKLPYLKTLPTTASSSSGVYQTLYERLFKQKIKHIISIHPPSTLSAIFNAASIAAQAFGNWVHVIDSGQVTLGLGFQVLAAAEGVIENLSLEAILNRIQTVRQRCRVIAMLDTLEYVRRSGRVSWARARLGAFLHIKPFIELKDGKVLSLGEARTRRKGIQRLIETINSLGPLERLAIIHTNAESEANSILDSLNVNVTTTPMVVNVTTVIGTHVGPNGLGFAAVVR